MRLKLPKNHQDGMKIYCNKCKIDNPKCTHFESHRYRIRVHVPGTKSKVKVKVLESNDYSDALREALDFKQELKANNYQTVKQTSAGNDFSVVGAILKYYLYLSGEHEFRHLKKSVTKGHVEESIRFCRYFNDVLKKKYNVEAKRIVEINQSDVADFYVWAEEHYKSPKTFNKCLSGVRAFFEFLINVEGVLMVNPFRNYVSQKNIKKNIQALSKEEFEKILNSIDEANPIKLYKDGKIKKNMYYSYLKDAFKLFLLTGARREEVLTLKWSDIYISIEGIKFFMISNLKVERSNDAKNMQTSDVPKFIPICCNLNELLIELGYNEKKGSDEYILVPDRGGVTVLTLMDRVSKSFTHYKEQCGITKDVSLRNLRKTYLSWVNATMMKDTRILSSHSSEHVLNEHYLDPTILDTLTKAALNVKIFGS